MTSVYSILCLPPKVQFHSDNLSWINKSTFKKGFSLIISIAQPFYPVIYFLYIFMVIFIIILLSNMYSVPTMCKFCAIVVKTIKNNMNIYSTRILWILSESGFAGLAEVIRSTIYFYCLKIRYDDWNDKNIWGQWRSQSSDGIKVLRALVSKGITVQLIQHQQLPLSDF